MEARTWPPTTSMLSVSGRPICSDLQAMHPPGHSCSTQRAHMTSIGRTGRLLARTLRSLRQPAVAGTPGAAGLTCGHCSALGAGRSTQAYGSIYLSRARFVTLTPSARGDPWNTSASLEETDRAVSAAVEQIIADEPQPEQALDEVAAAVLQQTTADTAEVPTSATPPLESSDLEDLAVPSTRPASMEVVEASSEPSSSGSSAEAGYSTDPTLHRYMDSWAHFDKQLQQHNHYEEGRVHKLDSTAMNEMNKVKRAWLSLARARPDMLFSMPADKVSALVQQALPYQEVKVRPMSSSAQQLLRSLSPAIPN